MQSLTIFGTGQMADIASYYFLKANFEIDSYISDEESISQGTFLGKQVFKLEDFLAFNMQEKTKVFVAISYHKQNIIRQKYFEKFRSLGYSFASFVSPAAYVADDVKVGENVLILEGSCIQKSCLIDSNSFLWTGVNVGHHSQIGKNVFLGSNTVLMGCNIIGDNCHLAASSTVQDHLVLSSFTNLEPGKTLFSSPQDARLHSSGEIG